MQEFEIEVDAPPPVLDALRRCGRIEDAGFSPDNRRLALPCFDRNSVAIVDVTITASTDAPRVALTEIAERRAPVLAKPHGVEFLDDDTIVVANRGGRVALLDVASGTAVDGGFEQLVAPSALTVVRTGDRATEVLVCDTVNDVVTRHLLDADARVMTNDVLLRKWLIFPDSVAVSDDDRWTAVCNHYGFVVMLYRRDAPLSENSDPVCLLRGAMYPHGVHFSAGGRRLFVADSRRPHVHVYARHGDTWQGVHHPDASIRVMTDEMFARGESSTAGPKGIVIDHTGRVMIVTFEHRPPLFFDVVAMVEEGLRRGPDPELRLEYEFEVMDRNRTRVDAILSSRSYRVTAPLRWVRAAVTNRGR
jgi:hypothetical protein